MLCSTAEQAEVLFPSHHVDSEDGQFWLYELTRLYLPSLKFCMNSACELHDVPLAEQVITCSCALRGIQLLRRSSMRSRTMKRVLLGRVLLTIHFSITLK